MSYPARETQHFLIKRMDISVGITVSVIDCSPTYLHDGKTLPGTLSVRDPSEAGMKRTSGSVALMKSGGNEVGCWAERIGTHFRHRNSLRLGPNARPARRLCNYRSSKRLCSYRVTSHSSAPRRTRDHSQEASTNAGLVKMTRSKVLRRSQEMGGERVEQEEVFALLLSPPAARVGS